MVCLITRFNINFDKYLISTALVSAHDLLLNPGYFEEHDFVHVDELKHIIQKRSLNDDSSTEVSRQVRFMALGRDFRLMLKENKEILSPLFKAFLVDGEGNKVRPFNRIAQSEFYHGHLHGNPGSHVSGHIDSDSGLMTVSIQDNVNNESFMIEPLFRHRDRFVNRENSSNSSYMIIYKEAPVTDLFQDPNRYCDFVKFNDSEYASPTNDLRDNEVLQNTADESVEIKEENFPKRNRRAKREMDDTDIRKPQTRCNLYLVADHFFYLHMNKELKATISFMVTAIDRINKMFLDTPFGEPESPDFMTGLGFVIHEINVHESESKVDRHYNAPRKYIRVRDLLEAFSNNINLMHYCLGHLFTYRRFDGGVLGLAYVAHTKKYVPGGICSTGIERNGQKYYYNTGLTSFMNTLEQPINTRISDLVTAHELAHNWGAEHDPETIECSPSSSTGGSYIMHTYSVSGYDDYNRKFSPCSRRAMHNVLLNRAATCFLSKFLYRIDIIIHSSIFTEPSKSYCGNGVVEEGEECDAGRFGEDEPDDCCNQTTCRLKEFAQCSDVNSLCCSFCKPAPLGTLCREASTITCQAPTVCDGKSSECPRFGPVLRDDTECIDGGRCNRGKCVSYCESIGKIPCLCDNPKFACRRCCRDGHRNTTCQPVDPIQILKDGTPCYNGVCERNGVCEKATQDVTLRLWGIIDRIDANSFGE